MVNRKTALKIRKTHRYLGLFLGVQFLLWTISGLYFSWTDIDEIHGDQFKNLDYQPKAFDSLMSPTAIKTPGGLKSIELRDINSTPHYWVNNSQLINANNGKLRSGITETEALYVAKKFHETRFRGSCNRFNQRDRKTSRIQKEIASCLCNIL